MSSATYCKLCKAFVEMSKFITSLVLGFSFRNDFRTRHVQFFIRSKSYSKLHGPGFGC